MAAFVFHGCDGIHPVHDCHRQRGPILRTYQNDVQKRKTGPSPLDQLTTETLELISRDGQHLSKLEYNTDKPNLTLEEDTRLNKLNISSLLKHDFIIHCSWNNINTVIYKSMPGKWRNIQLMLKLFLLFQNAIKWKYNTVNNGSAVAFRVKCLHVKIIFWWIQNLPVWSSQLWDDQQGCYSLQAVTSQKQGPSKTLPALSRFSF